MNGEAFRAELITEARTWLGTPYQHQASCKGAGSDCLGLLRGIWRAAYGSEPEKIPAYTADWSETDGVERLLEAAERHFTCVDMPLAGDLLIFRMLERSVAKHIAILSDERAGRQKIIHAYSGHGVVDTPLNDAWRRRIAGAYRFPDRRN